MLHMDLLKYFGCRSRRLRAVTTTRFKEIALFFCISQLIVVQLKAFPQQQPSPSSNQSQVVFEFSEVVIPVGDTRELAVAFHALTFIDSIGHSLGEIVFGTPQTNALQGDGWFLNDFQPNIGTIQWAGDASKQATMAITIPSGTEGLLLKIISVKDSLWMNVKIDGQSNAILLVDAYWHDGYVPIGEPVPESRPNTDPEWNEDRYFPDLPPTDRIYVFRVPLKITSHDHGAVQPEWRINQDYQVMLDLTLVGMQGIINRSRPRVYIEWYDPLWPGTDPEISWTPLLAEQVEIVRMDLDALSAISFLLRRYASFFAGSVVYDPEVPETINLATMFAGLEDRIILAPEQIDLPGIPDLSPVYDIRQLVQVQGWDTSEESNHRIYQWVYENLWPSLEHRIIGIVSPGPPTSREIGNSGNYFQLDLTPRDYLIALKLPALWLSPVDEPQATLLGQFLSDSPSPVPVTGVFGPFEIETVKIVSEHGDIMTGINWPGGWITTGGLSVLSGIRPQAVSYDQEIDQNEIFATLGAGHVATLTSSDGDAIYYLMGRGFGPRFGWDHVQNQRFSWTISPLLSEIAPVLWNYYNESRVQVNLMAGVSGVGYTHPVFMDAAELDRYLDYSARYLGETGLRTLFVPSNYFLTREVMSRYYDRLSDTGYLGTFTDWRFSHHNFAFAYTEAPAPAVWSQSFPLNQSNIQEVVDEILDKDYQAFVDVTEGGINNGEVVQDQDAHGGQAVLITTDFIHNPNHNAVYAHSINLLPGNYQVHFRLKVADNQDAGRVVSLGIYHEATSQFLASRDVTPSQFNNAGEYQSFVVDLSLARLVDQLVFQIIYDGGATDLYIDDIRTEQTVDVVFPYFAHVGIDNIGAATANVPGDFISAFENAGGVVIHPDEFMAALNPEFMIEFAAPLLGMQHPAITEAQQQLAAGEYFNSLMTVRAALSVYVGVDVAHDPPVNVHLWQSYPNPFNPSATIRFSLPNSEKVKLEVYNLLGQKMMTLLDEQLPAGNHQYTLHAENWGSGVYILRLEAGSISATRKMLHLK